MVELGGEHRCSARLLRYSQTLFVSRSGIRHAAVEEKGTWVGARLLPTVGALVGLFLGGLMVVGVVLEMWVLAAAAGALLGAAILAVQVDTLRRTRSLRNFVRDEIRRSLADGAQRAAVEPMVTQEDVVGAVRLLQAQYTGRLDRMQRGIDEALVELAAQRVDRNEP